MKESIKWPGFGRSIDVLLDPVPGALMVTKCSHLGGELRVNRIANDITLRPDASKRPTAPLTEEVIEMLEHAMPSQPWPEACIEERRGGDGTAAWHGR